MRISIIGTGYVGLVSGACFASLGFDVNCVDSDLNKLACLQRHQIDIYEPELEDIVRRNVSSGRLRFSSDLSRVVSRSDVVFIAVGTPGRSGGEAELSQVLEVSRQIADAMRGYTLIVTKSTVPVGTGRMIAKIVEANAGKNGRGFGIASNPEFLREGSAVNDFLHPDRVVIGSGEARAGDLLEELYASANLGPIFRTSLETAELIKYAANSFLATKIAFINEISDLCEKSGANIDQVATGLGYDRRIGPNYLAAGPGFGGSCLPKDTRALIATAKGLDVDTPVVEAVVAANDSRIVRLADRISGWFEHSEGVRLAVLGTTFKAETDDVRESPSLALISHLLNRGFEIVSHDPKGNANALRAVPQMLVCSDPYEAVAGSQALLIMTEWQEFRELDFDRLGQSMKRRLVFDFRNLLDADRLISIGFEYSRIGTAPMREARSCDAKF